MFYNVYRDLREKPSIAHIMLWSGYAYRDQAIKKAEFTKDDVCGHILKYVKTIETTSPYEHYDGIALSIYDKDKLWNQVLPEVHFYDAGRTQYR